MLSFLRHVLLDFPGIPLLIHFQFQRWFQTVRAKLVEDVAQTSSTSTTKRGDEKSVSIQKQIEELHNAELKIPQTIVDSEQIEPKLVPLSHE
jgi:hypothetical protein